MMLLSRFWYAILAVALGAAVALLYISIRQHNRLRESDTRAIIDHDRDIVDWYLRLDARRRLDVLGIVSVDKELRDALLKANGQDKIGSDVRDPLKKRLDALSQKYAGLMKDEGKGGSNPTALFAVDNRGRVAAHINFDRAPQVKDDLFEMGGFPVVADALHGFLRDDTWVLDRDSIYRVVARPVVASEGGLPVGAVVSVRRVDESFCKNIVDRTQAPVLFYVDAPDNEGGKVTVVARAVPDKSDITFDAVVPDAKTLASDKGYQEIGASSLKSDKQMTFAYTRLIGAGWDLGAGFAVARKVVPIADPITGPNSLLSGANEEDKKAIPWIFCGGIVAASLLIGILATMVEHGLPTNKLVSEARKFAKGDQDALPLAKLSGAYRNVGQNVNEGLERVIAKGGGASRKAADLEQILGPVPTAPQMSAFSFNFDGNQPGGQPAPGTPGGADLFPNLPPAAPAHAAPGVQPPIASPGMGSPPPGGSASRPMPKPAAPAAWQPPAAPISQPHPQPGRGAVSHPLNTPDEDEATVVGAIPEELRAASATGEAKAIENADEMVQWKHTFEEFVAMRGKCGEPTAGLSFEKFQVQLRKNKEQLVKQYNCRRVKFTVYEKDGKAALKATPIKD